MPYGAVCFYGCVLRVLLSIIASLVVTRSWNQFLRYSTLQVYYCTIVQRGMHYHPWTRPGK
ncbi:hypothetical protein HOLleu_15744 [Holothuria leucospilota]|uniref:Uncharacterized protein n=1 Tax=Holothuria leucospilota TaxID=206669 RepID=A0A9Q1C513_HOLLE|nr:hypothetical protein HOLleu_15744 [Holothuria leucospilota]